MLRLPAVIVAVIAFIAAVLAPSSPASAGPIDLPPDGEARLTISLLGDDDLDDRIELFLTAAGTDMFDSACAPIDAEAGAVATYECTGLMQRAHFLEAEGTTGDEQVAIRCGLPGGFGQGGGLADLRPYPYVLDCSVTVAEPGIRLFALDTDGALVDPPDSLELFGFFDGDTIDIECAVDEVGGDPARFCAPPAPGEYEVVADGDDTQVTCGPGLVSSPDRVGINDDTFVFFGDGGDGSGIVYTCVIRPFDDTASGTESEFFVSLRSSDPGPDLQLEVLGDGTDFLSDCVRVFEQEWICRDLPLGEYTVSASGALPGQVVAATCFDPEAGPVDSFDLAETPFGVSCSVEVDTPQIVFRDFERRGPVTYEILDDDGNDVGESCGPAVFDGDLVVSCPLPLGDYSVPEQDVAGFGVTEFICSQDRPWFFENTVTLSDTVAAGESIVVECQPGQPDRFTFLLVEVENQPPGAQLLLNGVAEVDGGACFDQGNGDPNLIVVPYFCEFQGAQTLTPSMGNINPALAPTIECRPSDAAQDSPPTATVELTEEEPEWGCRIVFSARLPDTGPSGETPAIAALGAAFLAAGAALTIGTRRRRLA